MCILILLIAPAVVFVQRQRRDGERHVGVLHAAELRIGHGKRRDCSR
jgi:hypothetical protein